MGLILTIENETSLPDGGPLSFAVTGRRSIDIGRDPYLDWALPDPTRTISGKHCEIRYRDGGYWLTDVSRNGTFLNRSDQRLQEAYRLRDGDRIEIGRYVIAVRVEGEEAVRAVQMSHVAPAPVNPADYWNASPEAAPPISARDLRPARESRPAQADFREWAIDVPGPASPPSDWGDLPPASANQEDLSWAPLPPAPPPPAAAPPVPSPRRPVLPMNPGWELDTAPLPSLSPTSEMDPVSATPDERDAAPWTAPVIRAPTPSDGTGNPWGIPAPPVQRAPPPADAQVSSTPEPARSAPPRGDPAEFLRRFAKGAAIPPDIFAGRDPDDLAEDLGALLRISAENLKQLLAARAETKRVARTGGQTTIQALDNNPLKFSPSVEDALRIMLGAPSVGYLDARRAFEQGFKDLKAHQVKTYSAMQHALRLLMEDLDPEAIALSAGDDGRLAGLFASRKAKLWDLYVARWSARTAPHEDGMVDAFMVFFAECYDRGAKG